MTVKMQKARILLVEHAESVAADTEKHLKGLGYAVCATVCSERQAVAEALETHAQIVLVGLAAEDGFDSIEVARQIGQIDLPVLFLTDGVESELLQRAGRQPSRLATWSGPSRERTVASDH